MDKIVCSIKDGIKKVAVLDKGKVEEIFAFRTNILSVGDIVIGRVSEKMNNLNAFFVDIGGGETGFLTPPREFSVNIGDIFPFEVLKEARGGKNVRLSPRISLAGAFIVYQPSGEGYHVARSIASEEERERLSYIAMDRIPGLKGGLMMRSAAAGIDEDTIAKELDFLRAKWARIEAQDKPGLAAKGLEPVVFLIAKYAGTLEKIVCDDGEFLGAIKSWSVSSTKIKADAFRIHASPEDLFEKEGIAEVFDSLLDKEVKLPSGGRIIIEPTAALVAIDVDSFSSQSNSFNVNMEAVTAALRQLRLRNLSGQIVIDLIKNKKNPEMVEDILKRVYPIAAQDSTHVRVMGLTPLGNLELTRERRFASIYEVFQK